MNKSFTNKYKIFKILFQNIEFKFKKWRFSGDFNVHSSNSNLDIPIEKKKYKLKWPVFVRLEFILCAVKVYV